MSRYQRRKGADSERALVAWFREHGYPEARRSFAGDGRQAGDIDGLNCVIEVKAHARPRINQWLAQLERIRNGYAGFLVWHDPGNGYPGNWPVYYVNGLGEVHTSRVVDIWGEIADDIT